MSPQYHSSAPVRPRGSISRVSILLVLFLATLAMVPQESHAFFGKIAKIARVARRIPGVGGKIGRITSMASRIPGVGGKIGAIKNVVGVRPGLTFTYLTPSSC
ncbi:hypothetical protein BCR44DRAFT_1440466 [Catenaria anguillulae PL171]|uniref:Uncharacterized protein n=1 Tax=Catenaria anguillulae PL171 TaxID=765915 RepID=A0A1Y2HGT7_9FUNG|nr:hypothetical protein BCR44DRAFT_1440466 [Catenaria anguillulae PL171]